MKRRIYVFLFAVMVLMAGAFSAERVEATRLSADNSLSTLKISGAELSPEFYYSTVNYTATVPYETTEVEVTARTSNAKAVIESVSGYENLSVGENKIKVVVVAENGNKATYTVKLTRLAEGETPADANASAGNGADEPAAGADGNTDAGTDGNTDAGTDGGNPEDGGDGASAEIKIAFGNTFFIVSEAPESALLSYTAPVELELEEIGTITAYRYADSAVASSLGEEDFYLIYGTAESGEAGWYQYDAATASYQRYVERTVTVEAPASDVDNGVLLNNYNNAANEVKQLKQKIRMMTYVFLFIIGILLIIMLSILWAKRGDDEETDIFDEEPKKRLQKLDQQQEKTIETITIERKPKPERAAEKAHGMPERRQTPEEKRQKEPEIPEVTVDLEDLSGEEAEEPAKRAKRRDSILAYLGLDDDLPLDYGDIIEEDGEEPEGEPQKGQQAKSGFGKGKKAKRTEAGEKSDIEFLDIK